MCSLTVILLLFPGTPLDVVWRIKPTAREELSAFGLFTIPLMLIIGAACGSAAVGLAKGAEWGRRMAIGILCVNLAGDTANAIMRANCRTLIGLPIGGLMIVYLMSRRVRPFFT